MPRKKALQTNFSAGEISPDIGMRQDTDQYQNGARSLLNRRCLIGGGTKRRPGSWWRASLAGPSRLLDFIVNQSTEYVLAFGDGDMFAYLPDGTAAGSVTGPWTGSIWEEMDYTQSGNTMFLTHPSMPVQKLVRTGAATWSVADMTYETGPASRPEQPYLKMVDDAITLQPSALTGSITLTIAGTTDPVFTADHVGQYVRYMLMACLITAVAVDGLSCTATVIETLPDTQDLTVTSSASFAVGEVVEGATSGAKGIVTSIPDATSIFVVISQGLQIFAAETLTGPNATTAISSVASAGTKAAIKDWDEQLFGPVYGYPSCVALHRNRLCFAGHPLAPDYLIASALGALYNFNVGDGSDGDAIIESIGDSGASKIVQLHSAEQLILGTDRGPYYCPEGQASPFRPSSIAFFPFGSPWPISSTAKIQKFDGGVIMVSGSLIIKGRPTGDLSRAWEADEVSILSPHLVNTPSGFTVTSNFDDGPERYSVFRNADGTLAIMQLVEVQKIRNFTPWENEEATDTYQSVVALGERLYAATNRRVGGSLQYILEEFDQDLTLDAVTEYDDLDDVEARYGATEVHAVVDDQYLGTVPLSLASPPAGPYRVGLFYGSTIETLPPVIEGPNGPAAGDRMRILEAMVFVRESARFRAEGTTLSAYQITDDVGDPPPEKNGAQRFGFMGWRREPTITITQPDPLPLNILAIRQEVAY